MAMSLPLGLLMKAGSLAIWALGILGVKSWQQAWAMQQQKGVGFGLRVSCGLEA
jgi:hypothetical protein